jgi:hypothetical protein
MHDNYEQMLRSISYDIKGAIDDAQMSLNEDAEIILNKVRSGKFDAMVTGLRDAEQYFERNDYCNQKTKVCKERIYCWMVSSITSEDYERAKRRIVNKISEADPRVHEAIINKTIDFFSEKKPALQEDKKADNIPNADSPAKGTDDTDAETNGEISMDMPLNQ